MPIRKIQRGRTGKKVPAVGSKAKKESDDSESSSSSSQGDTPKRKALRAPVPKNKRQEDGGDDDDDDDSFDSNQYEFTSAEESHTDDNDDKANDDDEDFSAGKSDDTSSSEDDMENDDESSVERQRRKPKPRGGTRGPNASKRFNQKRGKRQSASRNLARRGETSSEESALDSPEEESSSSEEENWRRTSQRRKAAKKQPAVKNRGVAGTARKRTKTKSGRNKHESSEENSSDHSSESSSEEEEAKSRASRAGTRRRAPASSKKPKAKISPATSRFRRKKEESDEEASPGSDSHQIESSDDQVVSRSNNRRRAQTGKRSATRGGRPSILESIGSRAKSDDDDDDANVSTPMRQPIVSVPTSSGSRSRRASAQKAMTSLAEMEDDVDDDIIPKSFRKKKSDDDEFELDQGEEEESEQEIGLDDEEEEESVDDKNASDDEKIGIVHDEDIGEAEEESEDENPSPYKSPQLHVEHQSPTRVTKTSAFQDIEEDESSDDDRKPPSFSPSMPACDSKTDAITCEDLPAKHVCCYAPDGRSKQCFSLETLHKVSTSAMFPQIRQTLTGRVVQAFLQPPHFRSPMSDDLLDQIASRFGREALDLYGDFYKRPKDDAAKSSGNDSDDELSLEATQAFVEQVQKYVRAQMGSNDLYVCPLCYVVARRKYNVSGELDFEAEGEKNDDAFFTDFMEKQSDPIEVMETLDETYSDSFLTASAFCFPTVAKVKYHLREDHHVQTKKIEGNELYASFKIRTTDGLLQRFLKSMYHGHVNQGAMQSYWFSGKNFDFVYLYSLVERAALYRSIAASDQGDDDEREEAVSFLEKAEKFFDSFEGLTKHLWFMISGPYRNEGRKDLKDFLADEDVDEPGASDGNAHRRLDQERARENSDGLSQEDRDRIARYKREEGDDVVFESESGEADLQDSEPSSDSEEENEGAVNTHASSSEEDEWEQDIRNKRKARSPAQIKSSKRQSRTSSRAEAEKYNLFEVPRGTSRSVSESSRKRLVIQESDEE